MSLWDVLLDTAIHLALFFPEDKRNENEEEEEEKSYGAQNDSKR